MMGICSHVLYQALQEDLASAVPGYQPGEPWPGMTPRQFAASALDKAFYKKFVEKSTLRLMIAHLPSSCKLMRLAEIGSYPVTTLGMKF
jgi:hypothetical protein